MHTIQKMNTERENLAATLREIATGSRRNKTARLRECFDHVEAAKAAGASNKTIVAGLEACGLFYDVPNFKNARSRILKERAIAALTQTSMAVQQIVPSKELSLATLKSTVPTAKKFMQTVQMQTTEPIKETTKGNNPFHALTGEVKAGEFNPVPSIKPEFDN